MARSNKQKAKKKAPVASRAAKSSLKVSRKESAVVTPLAFLDEKIRSIATIGENRENLALLSKKKHDYDLGRHVVDLMKEYPNHSVCIYNGSPQLLTDATTLVPHLGVILVPDKKLPPKYIAYKNKHGENAVVLKDMTKAYGMRWNSVAPGVYFLTSSQRKTKTSIKAMDEESKVLEEHLELFSRRPSVDWKLNKHGKLDVRFVNFTVPDKNGEDIYESFDKDGDYNLQSYVDEFLETQELGEDRREDVESAIRQAFEDKRDEIIEEMKLLKSEGFDEELLESIKTIKIYPKGTPADAKSRMMGSYYGNAHAVL
ncbi:expressed unknown protein [Seminavis robusta]|uniref:Uncharacterized protein n=1 Tax=Seminavis robusta TaxID=568900 RepID=A0A9N8DCX5_9STRA|nr:expressed unknown protein [Seminavis robusta]|eukprot:Sro19_g013400.1 n/a (314) ;mRNA; f:57891-58832